MGNVKTRENPSDSLVEIPLFDQNFGSQLAKTFVEFISWTPAKKVMTLMIGIQLIHFIYLAIFEIFARGTSGVDEPALRLWLWCWIGLNFAIIGVLYLRMRSGDQSRLAFNILMFAYMTALAWVASFVVYQGGKLLGFE